MAISLESVLSTLAYHVACIMADRPMNAESERVRGGFGLGGVEGTPSVHVDYEIRPSGLDADPWGVWAQVWLAPHGEALRCYGNRCGGREELVRLYAPVVAWVATRETVRPFAAFAV